MNRSLSRCATAEERISSAIFRCGVRPPSHFLQWRYTLSASPRHHCCHVSCDLKKQETRQQYRKALALRSWQPLCGLKDICPRMGPAKDRSVCLFCARAVRFRSRQVGIVQLSSLPCAKSLPARGEAFVPPGNDLNAYFTVNQSGVYRAQRDALWKSIR
jgi:hypothetical protein